MRVAAKIAAVLLSLGAALIIFFTAFMSAPIWGLLIALAFILLLPLSYGWLAEKSPWVGLIPPVAITAIWAGVYWLGYEYFGWSG